MTEGMKEVYYDKYCNTCEFMNKREDEEPCDECLNEPGRMNSHKPLKYEER